jgi:hypothetical protein
MSSSFSLDEKVNRSWEFGTKQGFPASRDYVGGRVAIVAVLDPPAGDQFVLSLKSICIPSSIETISENCFWNCTNLSILTFESGCKVSSLGDSAFAHCSSLQSICIPSSIETIANRCFSDCTNLSDVRFEEGCRISMLDDSVFSGCWSLASPVAIPRLDG